MLLGAFMASIPAPDPEYDGITTTDDYVFAINTAGIGGDVDTFAVSQTAVEGIDAQMGAAVSDKQYLRAGMSSTKTGTQRTFKVTGDRYIGDDFQDFVFSHDIKYGVGQAVTVEYVWFCLLNGRGEKGKAAIIVNSDGSGTAGNTASIDVDFRKTGEAPEPFTYEPASQPLAPLTVVSVPGALQGETSLYVNPPLSGGNSYVVSTGAAVSLPNLDDVLSDGWDSWNGTDDVEATDGHQIAVVEVDTDDKAKKGGIAIVYANTGD